MPAGGCCHSEESCAQAGIEHVVRITLTPAACRPATSASRRCELGRRVRAGRSARARSRPRTGGSTRRPARDRSRGSSRAWRWIRPAEPRAPRRRCPWRRRPRPVRVAAAALASSAMAASGRDEQDGPDGSPAFPHRPRVYHPGGPASPNACPLASRRRVDSLGASRRALRLTPTDLSVTAGAGKGKEGSWGTQRHQRHLVERGGLAVAIVVVLIALLAAPALAAPAPTTWTVSPQSKIITYGQGVTLNGTLMSNGAAVERTLGRLRPGHHAVRLLRGPLQGDRPDGAVRHGHLLDRGDAAADHVLPLPVAGRRDLRRQQQRRGPRPGQAVARQAHLPVVGQEEQEVHGEGHGQAGSRASGRPSRSRRTAGTAAAPTSSYKTYSATVSGTTYKASIKISKTGKYKFKATTAANAQFAANESGLSNVLTVKK